MSLKKFSIGNLAAPAPIRANPRSSTGSNLVFGADGIEFRQGAYSPAFIWGGTTSSYILGGAPYPQRGTVQKFSLSSDASATDVTEMAVERTQNAGGLKNLGVAGYTVGGSPSLDDIQKMPFATETVSTIGLAYEEPSYPISSYYGGYAVSSPTNGYYFAGYNNPNSPPARRHNAMKISFASDGNATSIKPTAPAIQSNAGSDWSEKDKGYFALGGNPYGANGPHILNHYEFTYSSETYTEIPALAPTVVPTFGSGLSYAGSAQSPTYAYSIGGNNSNGQQWPSPGAYPNGGTSLAYSCDIIAKFPFASLNTWSNIAELSSSRRNVSGSSSTTHGYSSGGYITNPSPYAERDIIEKFPFASDSPGVDSAELSTTSSTSAVSAEV